MISPIHSAFFFLFIIAGEAVLNCLSYLSCSYLGIVGDKINRYNFIEKIYLEKFGLRKPELKPVNLRGRHFG